MSIAVPAARPVLADRLLPRNAVVHAALVLAGGAVVAALAQLTIPMWPVPITGLTLGVLLVGASLGAWRGAASVVLYGVAGIAGLPVSAASTAGVHPTGLAWLAVPSFGYVVGGVLAAAVVGLLAELRWDRTFWKALVAFVAGEIAVYAVGLPWLAVALGRLGYPDDLATVFASGFTPFVIGDIVKALIAGALLPAAWLLVKAAKRR